ncbi:50S ribosomal protein L7/L12 [Candidatus Phycorickettsia trachydisci]|uniref:Large ribosomal subunit protein bL12 n=1 Tax=Candidatus Phycorickettsia trachydisci TaxID=2115978 RepID=A0A2P1PA64_9RICK|nr:50S ribosomal protein L7/L12 [Candidatus Phycorickettsia trachydisci]AVP88161.1 50S ribosomal protein L7/L12 [Candidatus Phycorickettsia trachydisci]
MADLEKIVDTLSGLKITEAAELVKLLEEKWGVSAAAPVAIAAAPAAGGAPAAEAKTSFDVVLDSFGEKKLDVIKKVKELTGLPLGEAKALVEAAPKPLKQGVKKDEAEKIKADLEAVGAKITLA